MADRFTVIRFTCDEEHDDKTKPHTLEHNVHAAIATAIAGLPGVALLSASTGGRDPQPPAADASAAHVSALRDAGHTEAAEHLESVAALHARSLAEVSAAADKLVHAMPHGMCVPGRPVHEHADKLLVEVQASRQAASSALEAVRAIQQIEHLIEFRPETTVKEIGHLIAKARANADARAARQESQAQRAAELKDERDRMAIRIRDAGARA